jgi:protein Xni
VIAPQSTIPPFAGDPSALVIVDLSWWIHKAWALADVNMLSMLVGWLCNGLLAYEPAHVVAALDSPGQTFRHRMQHPTDPDWKYKGHRPPKSEEFYAISRRFIELVELHAIPCLWADDYEGDDVAATITVRAREAGYRVWNCSADKDLAALVDADPKAGIVSGLWDNFTNVYRGPVEVFESYGVKPHQITDWLAIAGDSVDCVPGVDGLGLGKAADLLAQFVTLDAALARAPWTHDEVKRCEAKVKELAKAAKTSDEAKAERDGWMHLKRVAGYHATLHASADLARFSRHLTALDCDAPIDVPWHDLPVGGFDVAGLSRRYTAIGYTRKLAQVEPFRKPAPWSIPYGAP